MRSLLLAALLSFFCMANQSADAGELPSSNAAAINSALKSGKPGVVDFGAHSCIPCKKMAPILEELSRELYGKANVLFNDVWKDNTLAARYRIQMIPTQIFFDARGKEIKRHMGYLDRPGIMKELKAAGMK